MPEHAWPGLCRWTDTVIVVYLNVPEPWQLTGGRSLKTCGPVVSGVAPTVLDSNAMISDACEPLNVVGHGIIINYCRSH